MPKIKGLPWLVVLEAVLAAREHWSRLTPAERARLQHLVVASRGRKGNLTRREQLELRKLARKLDLQGLGRNVVPRLTRSRRRR